MKSENMKMGPIFFLPSSGFFPFSLLVLFFLFIWRKITQNDMWCLMRLRSLQFLCNILCPLSCFFFLKKEREEEKPPPYSILNSWMQNSSNIIKFNLICYRYKSLIPPINKMYEIIPFNKVFFYWII